MFSPGLAVSGSVPLSKRLQLVLKNASETTMGWWCWRRELAVYGEARRSAFACFSYTACSSFVDTRSPEFSGVPAVVGAAAYRHPLPARVSGQCRR